MQVWDRLLVANVGYFTRLDTPATSDKMALTAELFETGRALLEVLVAVGEKSPNPVLRAAAKVAQGVEIGCEGEYTLCSVITGGYTISEL